MTSMTPISETLVERLRKSLVIEYAVPLPVHQVLQLAADEREEAAAHIEALESTRNDERKLVEASIFDLLEPLSDKFPAIKGGFARGTGGVDIPFIVEMLAGSKRADELVEALREARKVLIDYRQCWAAPEAYQAAIERITTALADFQPSNGETR